MPCAAMACSTPSSSTPPGRRGCDSRRRRWSQSAEPVEPAEPAALLNRSDAQEQPVAEVSLEVGREDLLRGTVDVVRDPLALEGALLGVVDGVARAVVVVAGL